MLRGILGVQLSVIYIITHHYKANEYVNTEIAACKRLRQIWWYTDLKQLQLKVNFVSDVTFSTFYTHWYRIICAMGANCIPIIPHNLR